MTPLANTDDGSCYPVIAGCFLIKQHIIMADYDEDDHPNELTGDSFSRCQYK